MKCMILEMRVLLPDDEDEEQAMQDIQDVLVAGKHSCMTETDEEWKERISGMEWSLFLK